MPQPFLEAGEHRLLVAGLDVDDPVRSKPGLGDGRREQVLPGDAPQHLALGPGGDAGGEQRGRRAIDGAVAAAGDLVQRPECQPAAGKAAVDRVDAERQYRFGSQRLPVKTLNLLSKSPDRRWLNGDTHALSNGSGGNLFLLCPLKSS